MSVGAILAQDFGQGLQPVVYESRKLSSTEIRYSAYERELLGIIWAIGKWRHYLEGKHFIVQTDHSCSVRADCTYSCLSAPMYSDDLLPLTL